MISWWGDYLVVCVNLCLLGFTVLESAYPLCVICVFVKT